MTKQVLYVTIMLIAFLNVLPTSVEAQQQIDINDRAQYIKWSKKSKLKWENFSGKTPTKASADATTSTIIYFSLIAKEGIPSFIVTTLFVKDKSWKLASVPNSKGSSALLRHEQVHFDIAELYARRIRRETALLTRNKVVDVDQYTEVVKRVTDEKNRFDLTYDRLTEHGTNRAEQLQWEKRVKKLMKKAAKYSH